MSSKLPGTITETLYSIVIPIYNYSRYVERLLNSFPDDMSEEYEIIFVDDCSTDSTVEVIKSHFLLERIVLLSTKTNSGTAKARNMGANYAKGRYLLFFDTDITFMPDTFSNMEMFINNFPCSQCCLLVLRNRFRLSFQSFQCVHMLFFRLL
jgi:glycosyltransferase involved in cell wall biosynthesis